MQIACMLLRTKIEFAFSSLMKKTQWLPLTIIIAILALAAVIGYALWEKNHEENSLTLYGNIDIRQVDLGFRVSGKLKTMFYEEGDVIHQGDLLAELDDAPYKQSFLESEAKFTSIRENLAYAETQLKRRSPLVQEKTVSQEDYQNAYYNQKILTANLLEAAASMENSRIRLQDTRLVCPSDGVVYTRIREPGTVLSIGEPVYSVAVNTPIWARTYISEPDLGRIYPGMAAEVYTDTPENPVYEGRIGFISPIAEFTPKNVETPDLRTNLVYQLRVIINNPDKGLRQGMPVTVKLKS